MSVLKTKSGGLIYQVGGPGTPQPSAGVLPDVPATISATWTFTAVPTSPGVGSSSERFGASSAAAGANAAAYGQFSSASGAQASAFGWGAVASASFTIAVGRSSSASASGAAAFGYSAIASGTSSTAIGGSALAPAASSVVVGSGATVAATETGAIAIGAGATVTVAVTGGGQNIAIGHLANAGEWRATAIGYKAAATAISSTAVGRGARATATHAIAIGRGAWANVGGQLVLGFNGGNGQVDFYLDNGHTHKYDDPVDSVTINLTPSLCPFVFHGYDAFDATASPTNDIAGGHLVMAAGCGTGTAIGGSFKVQTAPAAGATSNTKNTLVTRLEIDSAGVWFVGNATAAPGSNPVAGGYLYIEAGALKYRGSAGTVTPLAAA